MSKDKRDKEGEIYTCICNTFLRKECEEGEEREGEEWRESDRLIDRSTDRQTHRVTGRQTRKQTESPFYLQHIHLSALTRK